MYIVALAIVFFVIAFALFILVGSSKQNQEWDESNKRIEESIGRGFGEAEVTQLRKGSGAEKWRARVGE